MSHAAPASLEAFAARLIRDASPLSQNVDAETNNIGFGWIYYALVRNLRPRWIVAIGSCRGFMPFVLARAARDNGQGHVLFIDPGFSGGGDPGWSGEGFWTDRHRVATHIDSFDLAEWMTHLACTSEQALPIVRARIGEHAVGLVVIDGAHTHRDSLSDFEMYSSLMREGVVAFHDALNTACEVSLTLRDLAARRHPIVTLRRDVGLALVEVGGTPRVEDYWNYLWQPSNRGEKLLPYARELFKPGDRVMEIYCGYSPLAQLMPDVSFFGWDRDGSAIAHMRDIAPQNDWCQVDELSVPFSGILPEACDGIVGLGCTRPYAAWDAQFLLDNVRYLVGRYRPRAALFEAAADYHDADILDDLEGCLLRHEYDCRRALIETDLTSFARRKLVFAQRR